jgi:hypothetical protein
LPTPEVDAVTVNRWVAGKQCPTSFYVGLLVQLSGRAIEAFERGLAELPATHYRNRGVFLGQLAFAYAVQGIPDAAVSYGRQAHEAARATASHRIVSELKGLAFQAPSMGKAVGGR